MNTTAQQTCRWCGALTMHKALCENCALLKDEGKACEHCKGLAYSTDLAKSILSQWRDLQDEVRDLHLAVSRCGDLPASSKIAKRIEQMFLDHVAEQSWGGRME